MRRTTALFTSALALFAGTAALTGCQSENRMAEATARGLHNVRYHAESGAMYRLYSYYPDQQVYYSAFQDRYWFLDDSGSWQESTRAPASFDADGRVRSVELATTRPYFEHEMVAAEYPSIAELEIMAGYTPPQQRMDSARFANANSANTSNDIAPNAVIAGANAEH